MGLMTETLWSFDTGMWQSVQPPGVPCPPESLSLIEPCESSLLNADCSWLAQQRCVEVAVLLLLAVPGLAK